MKKVSIGIIGCGVIGRTHIAASAQSPIIELAALADLRESVAREMANEYGVKTVYTDADALINDPGIDAVVLAVPTAGRAQLAVSAFEKGKHVLVEKPVGMNADEVNAMIKAKGNLIAGCCSSRFRHYDSADAVSKLIESNALGQLRELSCRVIQAAPEAPKTVPPAWRQNMSMNGGGILVNWGCYDIDYLLGITGWTLKPRWVLAQTWKVAPQFAAHVAPGSDAESHYSAFIKCEDGTVITIDRGEFAAVKTEGRWEIVGTKGSVRLNMIWKDGKEIFFDDTDPQQGVISKVLWKGDDKIRVIHDAPVSDFAQAILDNRQPKTSLEQALLIQKITDAIYESAETGKAVEII